MSNTYRLIEWAEENPQKWQVHKASTSQSKHMKHYCRWCGECKDRKYLYKLRDGPVDWWFCNEDHALEWLHHRHSTPAVHEMLRRHPRERNLDGKSIEAWVRDELSHRKV